MDDRYYVVSVEDPDGHNKVAAATYGSESEARRGAETVLHDPAYEGCTVWLTLPGGETEALTAT